MTDPRKLSKFISQGGIFHNELIEINEIHNVTVTADQVNYVGISTLGTSEPSKVLTADASGNIIITGDITVNGSNNLNVGSINVNNNTISTTSLNENLLLEPNGTGTISVPSGYETRTGFGNNSLVNKLYVDNVITDVAESRTVRAATTADLGAIYNNGTQGVNATLTIPAIATLNIDSVTSWSLNDGILVKNQTNAFENGRYIISTIGDATTAWVLTRCKYSDESIEIPSMFITVQEGNVNIDTDWIASVVNLRTFTVGVDDITFRALSGSSGGISEDSSIEYALILG